MTRNKWYLWFLSNCDNLTNAVDVLGLAPMDAIRALKEARRTTTDSMGELEFLDYEQKIDAAFWETVADIKALA